MTLTDPAQSMRLAAPLVASVAADGASTVVALRGEADRFTLPVVIDALSRVVADTEGPVVIDLAHTDFIDAETIRTLGRAWQFLGDRGRPLTVRSPSRIAIRVLSLVGLAGIVEPDQARPPAGSLAVAPTLDGRDRPPPRSVGYYPRLASSETHH